MISTIPPAFPNVLNTCGRITVHSTGRYVLVSNRGHDSICVLSVEKNTGLLQVRKAVDASMFAVMKRKENVPMERLRDFKRRVIPFNSRPPAAESVVPAHAGRHAAPLPVRPVGGVAHRGQPGHGQHRHLPLQPQHRLVVGWQLLMQSGAKDSILGCANSTICATSPTKTNTS